MSIDQESQNDVSEPAGPEFPWFRSMRGIFAGGGGVLDRRTVEQLSQRFELDALEAIDLSIDAAKADAPSWPFRLCKLGEDFHLHPQNAGWPLDAAEVVHEGTDIEPESGLR